MTIEFSEAIIVPNNITFINQTVFDVRIIPQNLAILGELDFYWQTVDFNNLDCTFSLKFTNPLVVSQEMSKDKLEIRVKDPTLLISKKTFKRIKNETSDEYEIPPQQYDTSIVR